MEYKKKRLKQKEYLLKNSTLRIPNRLHIAHIHKNTQNFSFKTLLRIAKGFKITFTKTKGYAAFATRLNE